MVGGTRLATLSTPIFDLYDDEGIKLTTISGSRDN